MATRKKSTNKPTSFNDVIIGVASATVAGEIIGGITNQVILKRAKFMPGYGYISPGIKAAVGVGLAFIKIPWVRVAGVTLAASGVRGAAQLAWYDIANKKLQEEQAAGGEAIQAAAAAAANAMAETVDYEILPKVQPGEMLPALNLESVTFDPIYESNY
jgi:hypothetical protein